MGFADIPRRFHTLRAGGLAVEQVSLFSGTSAQDRGEWSLSHMYCVYGQLPNDDWREADKLTNLEYLCKEYGQQSQGI